MEAKLGKIEEAFAKFLATREAIMKAGDALEKACGEFYDEVDEEYTERVTEFDAAGIDLTALDEGKWRDTDWRAGVLYELEHQWHPSVEDGELAELWSKSAWNEATKTFKKGVVEAKKRVAELKMASKDVPQREEDDE